RMILGTGLMLAPLVLLGAVGYHLYQRTFTSFEKVMQQTMNIMLPIGELQRLILQTDVPLKKYLVDGDNSGRLAFIRMAQLVDSRFAKLSREKGLLPDYHDDIRRAEERWQQAHDLSMQLIAESENRPPVLSKEIARYEQQQQQASQTLERLYGVFENSINKNYQNARFDRRQIQVLLLLIFFTGAIVAFFVGNRLARQVLNPLDKLRRGTERFGRGELDYRIETGHQDEFGQLARTFNEMADELEFLAAYDNLTGLLNRREFDNRLNDEVRRAKRVRRPFVLLLMDVDFFKNVNDNYGHQAGDHVLRVLAALLKKQVREVDYVGRTGGEEFGIILTETSEQDARDTAERIRQVVEEKQFAINDQKPIHVTLSIGLASYPDDGANTDMLISYADEALYRAKDGGRNRVVAFSD
ncbi:MAG: diguanylate cyclase, partial [Thiohalophilus sp.]